MSEISCRAIRKTLAARVLDTGAPPPVLEAHVATCLRCQAVVASSQRLRRMVAGLGVDPPLDDLDSDRNIPGWVAAGVASVAAAVVLARRLQETR